MCICDQVHIFRVLENIFISVYILFSTKRNCLFTKLAFAYVILIFFFFNIYNIVWYKCHFKNCDVIILLKCVHGEGLLLCAEFVELSNSVMLLIWQFTQF